MSVVHTVGGGLLCHPKYGALPEEIERVAVSSFLQRQPTQPAHSATQPRDLIRRAPRWLTLSWTCLNSLRFSVDRFVRCDVANVDAVTAAIAGAWAVIHLAAVPDDAPFASALVPANIEGVAAVIAAVKRTTSVKRLLIASSGKIFSGYSGATPIDVDTPPAPTCMYSATKLFAEAAALALANSVLPDRELHVLVPR